MNAPDTLSMPSSVDQYPAHGQTLTHFPLEGLQHLDIDSALRCQMMLGHGGTFGIWETTEAMIPHMSTSMRRIDLRQRIASSLPSDTPASAVLDKLLNEGVLWMTRLALLMRLGPAGVAGRARLKRLDASTVAGKLYQYQSKLVALGVSRRLEGRADFNMAFVSSIPAEDLGTLWAKDEWRWELRRLTQLRALGLWSDAPVAREFQGNKTAIGGTPTPRTPERKKIPHPPLPDDYMAEMGPRVLWLIKDVGPNLIHLLETLPTIIGSVNANQKITFCVTRYFETNVWRDRNGQVIKEPPFDLMDAGDSEKPFRKDHSQHEPFEWPSRNWRSVQTLAKMLQSAHIWMALLVMAARVSEVATLKRNCVVFARDGQAYANGRTFKASRALEGREREWPLPEIMVGVFSQQVKLVEASERLARIIDRSAEMATLLGDSNHLWSSLGASSKTDATEKLSSYDQTLERFAARLGMPPKPGGRGLYPHRFRKTVARLAGLAIDGSQKVLMMLLGHEDVAATLGYMQSDRAFAKEVDDITRELRIMRGEALIEDMRAALRDPNSLPYGGHGGGGALVFADSVRSYEEELHRSGKEWGVNTARELSVLLTNNGESARLISAHVVCTKVAGEVGLCSSKKGAIVASNCQTECSNRIEDKTGRRDTERVIPILVQNAQENIDNNDWLPLARDKKQLELELKRYDDIGAQWRAKPEVQAILGSAT